MQFCNIIQDLVLGQRQGSVLVSQLGDIVLLAAAAVEEHTAFRISVLVLL